MGRSMLKTTRGSDHTCETTENLVGFGFAFGYSLLLGPFSAYLQMSGFCQL
jgi:hypothetical protein